MKFHFEVQFFFFNYIEIRVGLKECRFQLWEKNQKKVKKCDKSVNLETM